jgi:biopolymer transport protein TolQ
LEHPFFITLTRSGPVGQSILAGLILLSFYTWAIIVAKARTLSRAEKECRAFLARFREGGAEWLVRGRVPGQGPLAAMFESGLAEFSAQRELVGAGQPLDAQATARIEAAMETEAAETIAALEKGHVILAIGASMSPFAGLFGTTWGIMNAFRSMGLEGSAGIAAVAPGVAEALVTTMAGLAVAIPAVVSFNLFSRRVRLIVGLIDRFQAEFLRAAHYACRMGGGAAAKQQTSREPFFSRRNS